MGEVVVDLAADFPNYEPTGMLGRLARDAER